MPLYKECANIPKDRIKQVFEGQVLRLDFNPQCFSYQNLDFMGC